MTPTLSVIDLQVIPNDCPLSTSHVLCRGCLDSFRESLCHVTAVSPVEGDPLTLEVSFEADQPVKEAHWEVCCLCLEVFQA